MIFPAEKKQESGEVDLANNTTIDLIYQYVREQILIGNLRENDKIGERAIGERFGVSKTVVREAFYELKKNGWIYAREKSGTYVTPVDDRDIIENYEGRIRLEPVVLAMAFPFLTKQDIAYMRQLLQQMTNGTRADYIQSETGLHLLFIQKSNNRYVSGFFSSMHEGMMRAASRTSAGSGQRKQDSIREWQQIIDLLDKGDILMACHFLEMHIVGSYRSFLDKTKSRKETEAAVISELQT